MKIIQLNEFTQVQLAAQKIHHPEFAVRAIEFSDFKSNNVQYVTVFQLKDDSFVVSFQFPLDVAPETFLMINGFFCSNHGVVMSSVNPIIFNIINLTNQTEIINALTNAYNALGMVILNSNEIKQAIEDVEVFINPNINKKIKKGKEPESSSMTFFEYVHLSQFPNHGRNPDDSVLEFPVTASNQGPSVRLEDVAQELIQKRPMRLMGSIDDYLKSHPKYSRFFGQEKLKASANVNPAHSTRSNNSIESISSALDKITLSHSDVEKPHSVEVIEKPSTACSR